MTAEELKSLSELMHAVLAGVAPVTFFEVNWSAINDRAKSDKTTLSIPGLVGFDAGTVRAKSRK